MQQPSAATSSIDDAWVRAFQEVFSAKPTPRQLEHLRWIQASSGDVSPLKRLRRIIAGFDQQDLSTAVQVRWSADDVQLHTIEGIRAYLDEADISISHLMASGAYEPHLVAFFNAFLKPGMHVVDVGAHVGFYTLLSAARVGPEGKVWSFEPNSENARMLLASADVNGFANIQLHPVALGEKRGHVQFVVALGSNGALADHARRGLLSERCRIVPVSRLDDFAIDRIDLLKMDVEGAEGLVLTGGMDTLRRCRPLIATEFSPEMLGRISGWSGRRFFDAMLGHGYLPFFCSRETSSVVPIADVEAFLGEFEGTLRIEDLVFCPRERVASMPGLRDHPGSD